MVHDCQVLDTYVLPETSRGEVIKMKTKRTRKYRVVLDPSSGAVMERALKPGRLGPITPHTFTRKAEAMKAAEAMKGLGWSKAHVEPHVESRHRNPDEDAEVGVKLEIDTGGARNEEYIIIDPEEFMAGGYGERARQKYTDLYLFGFGAYGWTRLLVWEPDSLEEALEKAAEWLAQHAPGHIMEHGSDELQSLYKEAAEDLGYSWPLDPDDEGWDEVDQEATADLTYTESGYLTSYEWSVNDIDIHDPLYLEAFEASLERQRPELDEDEEEKATKLLDGLSQPKKNPRRGANPKPRTKKLEWDWSWPVMGSHVPSNRHYDADAPLGSMPGLLHLFPAHDGWKVYWETTDRHGSRLEGEGHHTIGRAPSVAKGKSMAQKWYDNAMERLARTEGSSRNPRAKTLAGVVSRGGR